MKRISIFILVIIFVLNSGCGNEETTEPYDFSNPNFENRTYIITVPDNYDPANPSPLLFAFHGYSINGKDTQELTDFDELSKSQRYIVVYPNSLEDKGYWTDGCGCHGLEEKGVDDVKYVDYLLDKIKKQYAIDTTRIYAMGISQGAAFVQYLACRRAEKFAAFSSYIGSMRELAARYCIPKKPVNMIIMNGTDDQDAHWEGLSSGSFSFLSIPDLFEKWAGFDGCTDSVSTETLPDKVAHIDVEKIKYVECSSGKELILYKILRGVHTLYRNAEFDFSVETINFFSSHTLNN